MPPPPPPPPVLMNDLVEEVLLRFPPDEPAWLVRASAVCKPWRQILAAPRFRRRYREFHRTPPLLGFFEGDASFVSISALLPAQPHLPGMSCIDCRHGRALFAPAYPREAPFQLTVLDPATGHQRCVLSPDNVNCFAYFSAAVLCAVQGCDHRSCQGGHFRVAFVSMDITEKLTSAWLYSSETGTWSEPAFLHDLNAITYCTTAARSVLVGDALYFNNLDAIIKYQLSALRLSRFEKPITYKSTYVCRGSLMTVEDRGLGFAAVVEFRNLTMWSMETGPEGAVGWVKLREIDLKTMLSDDAFSIPTQMYMYSRWPIVFVSGFVEGTQVIFVSTYVGCYMVDLKSGRVRKVSCYYERVFLYVSFYIPAMEAACTGQSQ